METVEAPPFSSVSTSELPFIRAVSVSPLTVVNRAVPRAGFDLFGNCFGVKLTRQHVVSQNLRQRFLVLRLDQCADCAGWAVCRRQSLLARRL